MFWHKPLIFDQWRIAEGKSTFFKWYIQNFQFKSCAGVETFLIPETFCQKCP